MINDLALFFEQLAENMGVEIRIPRPGKKLLNASFGINLSVGITFLIGGIILSKKFLSLIGSMGLVSAVVLALEINDEKVQRK